MRVWKIKSVKSRIWLKLFVAAVLFTAGSGSISAQHRGAPVKKDRLLKALRSRQLQTGDIVSVINSNGVDFHLTSDVRRALIAAGARPELIRAVAENSRLANAKENNTTAAVKTVSPRVVRRPKPLVLDYEDLLEKAMFYFEEKHQPQNAVKYLDTAAKMKPNDFKAYQMLGFVNLYGLNNVTEAQKHMRDAIAKGGSAVFRVFHDDDGSFTKRCTGSLYISPERVRFESDDNAHTFETSTPNVERIKLDRETSKIWKNRSFLKMFLKIGKDKAKFSFAPVSGKVEESKMVAQFISESQASHNFAQYFAANEPNY